MSKPVHGLKKGQRLKLRIESIASGGQGFARHDGTSIFVDRGVPGDLAELELYDVRKDFAHARIAELIEPSKLRQEAPCKLFKVCGGCQWQHVGYEHQLDLKTDIVRQVAAHIGGINPGVVRPAIGAHEPFHYRNKVQYPVSSPQKSKRILAGYYKEGSHELVNIKHCPVQPEPLDQLLESAKLAAEHSGFSAYDEKSHGGLIRHFLARYSFSEKESLLTVVLNVKPESFAAFAGPLQKFAAEIMKANPSLVGVCANINAARGNRIMGAETKLIAGRDYIIEKLKSNRVDAPQLLRDGVSFLISPASFFQVNSNQTVELMDLILDGVTDFAKSRNMNKVPLILDAFAGVASIAIWISALAQKVLAVEEIDDAVKDAEKILKLNSIGNVEPTCGTVEEVFPKLVEQKLNPEIVILDPPRKGVNHDVLKCVAQLNPERIIYVSCNPATLARDLKILEESGYQTQSIQPVDLFPQTYHVESVSILDRKN